MMASSTTRPVASTSASSVSRLIEKPSSAIIAKVPISDSGMVTSGTSTARGDPRNANTTSPTIASDSNKVITTSWMEAWMKSALSSSTTSCIAGGICRRSSSTSRSRVSATASVLASGVGLMSMKTPCRSLEVRRNVSGSVPNSTLATSPSRTMRCAFWRTTSWRNWSASCSPEVMLSVADSAWPWVLPMPVMKLLLPSAV